MMFKKIILAAFAVAALSTVSARAEEYPTKEQILQQVGTSWSGSWDWTHDDGKGDSVLTLKGDGKVHYSYAGGLLKGDYEGEMNHDGGNAKGAIVINFTLEDGNELRFRWVALDKVEGEFWEKGKKAGQTKNNPAQTVAVLTLK